MDKQTERRQKKELWHSRNGWVEAARKTLVALKFWSCVYTVIKIQQQQKISVGFVRLFNVLKVMKRYIKRLLKKTIESERFGIGCHRNYRYFNPYEIWAGVWGVAHWTNSVVIIFEVLAMDNNLFTCQFLLKCDFNYSNVNV